MMRTAIGASVGFVVAILLIAVLAAYDGYVNGVPMTRLPPGMRAAVNNVFFCVAYFWPIPAACGTVIGGLAGFGSWLVRPRLRGAK